jgi:hypothetical protein
MSLADGTAWENEHKTKPAKDLRSEHYYGPVHEDINLGMPRYVTPGIVQLRASVQRHARLQHELASLANALESTNIAGDFESGLELTRAERDREHELACLEQEIWVQLRKEFL